MLLYIVHYESTYQHHKLLFLFGILFIHRNWLVCIRYAVVSIGVWGFLVDKDSMDTTYFSAELF